MLKQRGAPYYFVLSLFTLALLWVDSVTFNRWVQFGLGLIALALLLVIARRHDRITQREMWLTFAISGAIELFGTQVWGLYGYALGNVPWYVFPGHGLIAVVCVEASRADAMKKYGQWLVRGVFAVGTLWAIGGLTIYPAMTGRYDIHGAMYWWFFALLMWRSPRAVTYAWTFIVASAIEIVGVSWGTWHWAEVMPGFGFQSSPLPSCVAGGYCFFAWLGSVVSKGIDRWRLPKLSPGAQLTEG